MVYLYEILCIPTNEVYYSVSTEDVNALFKRMQSPSATQNKFFNAVLRYGRENFKIDLIATYTNQKPAILAANKFILKAQQQDRTLNSRLLSVNNRRNAKR